MIHIDREKCVGCGQCVNACVGGALAMVEGKAKLVREDYCDGLGVCVGECPVGALVVEEREVDSPQPTPHAHLVNPTPPAPVAGKGHGSCPGLRSFDFKPAQTAAAAETPSALSHWPVQLHLVNPALPALQGASLLVAATCSAFSCGAFHGKLLAGKALAVACPKLDRTEGYVEKLAAIFRQARPHEVTIARMEVPCCSGLSRMVAEARERAGVETPVREVILTLQGAVKSEREMNATVARETSGA